ncbi:transposase family protein [Streptococcus pyogenes]|uniref:Transposase family protein n=1 Tax=Streptococcus pyogenes TaxID=1314 RepID=A0A8B6J6H6_STRPY|nr:transposase family protein [Streptococcus pyogenes]VHD17333.1 transposase family protein [Streptococcus pyogenes]VHD19092.1 transposase family protein [Streptococcus pyogenes]VHD19381.1 transposase family protein [Streptococcus pyogenes]
MPRKTFDKAFKLSAVKLILEEEQPVKMVSSTLKIHPNSLYRYMKNMEKVRSQDMGAHFVMLNLR